MSALITSACSHPCSFHSDQNPSEPSLFHHLSWVDTTVEKFSPCLNCLVLLSFSLFLVSNDFVGIPSYHISASCKFSWYPFSQVCSFCIFFIIEQACHRHLCQTQPYKEKLPLCKSLTLLLSFVSLFLYISTYIQSGFPFFHHDSNYIHCTFWVSHLVVDL